MVHLLFYFDKTKKIISAIIFSLLFFPSIAQTLTNNNPSILLSVSIKNKNSTNKAKQGLAFFPVFPKEERFEKKEDLVFKILEKVWKNRSKNALKSYPNYTFNRYEKNVLSIDKIEKLKNKNFIEKKINNIFRKLLPAENSILPIYFRESYYQIYGKNHSKNLSREDLLARNDLGIKEDFILRKIKSIKLGGSIYGHSMNLLNKIFTSPLSPEGLSIYQYELNDSREDKLYKIRFWPKSPFGFTFKGEIWIDKTSFLITKIKLYSIKQTNFNFIKDFYIEQDFSFTEDSYFFLSKEHIEANIGIDLASKLNLLLKTDHHYHNHFFEGQKKSYFFYQRNNPLTLKELKKDSTFWKKIRSNFFLNEKEEKINTSLKNLDKNSTFNLIHKTLDIISKDGYVNLKKIDLGPFNLLDIFKRNSTEGWRIEMGARTFFNLNDFWRLNGYLAYGLKDKKIKYNLGGKTMIWRPARLIIGANYNNDIKLGGWSSLFNKNIKNPSYNQKVIGIYNSIEFIRNLEIGTSFYHSTSSTPKGQEKWLRNLKGKMVDKLINFQIGGFINFRPWAKYLSYGIDRVLDPSIYFPTFNLSYGVGLKNLFNSEFTYQKIDFNYNHSMLIAGLGLLNINLNLGKINGQVPFHMLKSAPLNLDFLFTSRTFTQLKPFEFLMDIYSILFLKHNFNGEIFKQIPVLKLLKLREVVFLRSMWGDLSNENESSLKEIIYKVPTKPYFEYGFGVENIGWGKIRPLGLYFNWRGNYLDVPKKESEKNKIKRFGFNLSFDFLF